ncbi:MAG: DUF2279 domain-containing protein [Ignavibacteriaceae bacterium]
MKCFLSFLFLTALLNFVFSSPAYGQGVIDTGTGEMKVLSKSEILQNIKGNLAFTEMPLSDPLYRQTDTEMLVKMGLVYSAGWGIIHYYKQRSWWQSDKVPFHWYFDWDYAESIDKVGHFYGATMLAHAFGAGLEASNVELSRRVWYASALALLFQTYVEIEDGFAPEWGFSPPDMACNVLGAFYPVLQYYEPFFYNFQVKMSYFPVHLNKVSPQTGRKHIFIDDYEGQKYWLTAKVHKLLPEEISAYWPRILNLAFGMGVSHLRGVHGTQDFYVALDIDTEEIPLHGEFWQFLKRTFNYIHLPMPGVRVTNGVAFLGLCY